MARRRRENKRFTFNVTFQVSGNLLRFRDVWLVL